MNLYETDELLGQYMEFHFGEGHFGVGNYPAQCALICQELMTGRDKRSALDLGCAVGRSSFELARVFDQVTGLDLSNRFIASANRMKGAGSMDYFLREQGELGTQVTADLAEFGLDDIVSKVEFAVADACDLAEEYTGYDLIFAGNLIDRLEDPVAFLASLHRRLVPGGVLVISSPYTLMEEYTPKANWVGGFRRKGEPFTVLDGMREVLAPHFEQLQAPVDVPFVIRETARKFQHTIAELTAWQRIR
ncbi:putative 4-mercaptohistidine N1-methyltransferase [Marinobacter sp.]|uniref:putative 4-mercaptohistidine N1-methyltransferase n=1 Tax=Marinobacter sp. TaxID=50741 RepID=UPI003851344B